MRDNVFFFFYAGRALDFDTLYRAVLMGYLVEIPAICGGVLHNIVAAF